MKSNLLKIIAVIVFSIIFASAVNAQEKAQATLIGEYYRAQNISALERLPANAAVPNLECGEDVCVCPTLKVSGSESLDTGAGYPTFTAKILGGDEDDAITYDWKVSNGKIIEGQG